MKNLQTTERPAQCNYRIFDRLKKINTMINSPAKRELGYEKLTELESNKLGNRDRAYCYYLNARYFVNVFKENPDIDNLEWANDFLDDMVAFAYENGISICDDRQHFTRAHVKFQLAQLVWEDERKEWLLAKASSITTNALNYNPENESFLWLKDQLAA